MGWVVRMTVTGGIWMMGWWWWRRWWWRSLVSENREGVGELGVVMVSTSGDVVGGGGWWWLVVVRVSERDRGRGRGWGWVINDFFYII